MNKSIKIFMSLLLAIALLTISVAQINAETIMVVDGFSYTVLNNNYASICDWAGGIATLAIPNRLDTSYVKEIAGWAFSSRNDFSGVSFNQADYLDTIGTMAFKNCTGITGSIEIPPQVKKINLGAFQGCSSVVTLYYNTRADIPEQGFYNCVALETVALDDGVKKIGKLAFSDCSSLSFIRIPNGMESIGDYAFQNCTALSNITIPDSVNEISPTAFKNCDNLIILCTSGSYAAQFAEANNIKYITTDTYKMGDINLDGKVNIRDVTYIQLYKVGKYSIQDYKAEYLADVTRDGEINIRDATYIQLYLVGRITSFDNLL